MLVGWWNAHRFPPPPQHLLPATGFLCDGIAAGFLYLTNSPIAWMEWVVCDPTAPKEKRGPAIDALIDHLCLLAKKSDSSVVFTAVTRRAFEKRLKSFGFVDGDRQTNHLIRVLT